jgi:hypothetical protein
VVDFEKLFLHLTTSNPQRAKGNLPFVTDNGQLTTDSSQPATRSLPPAFK